MRLILCLVLPVGVVVLAAVAGRAQPTAPEPGRVPQEQVVAALGIAVHDAAGKEFGRIVDVLVDAAGHPRAAVIDVGGFLGVGSRKVAVQWQALHFVLGKTPSATLAIAAERIKAAPAYDPAKPVEAVGAAGAPASP